MNSEQVENNPVVVNQGEEVKDQTSPWKKEVDIEEAYAEYAKTKYMAGDIDLEEILEVFSWQQFRLVKQARVGIGG